MRNLKKVLLFSVFIFSVGVTNGQQIPVNPISYRVFCPYIFNPAIAGSKDYVALEAIASFQGKYKSQIISANGRFTRPSPSYISATPGKDFTNIGAGGFLFNDVSATSTSIGFSAAGAYHIPLKASETSFFSIGAAVKGVYNKVPLPPNGTETLSKETYFPNMDFGVYYYSPKAYIGLSAVNLLGNPDTTDISDIPVTREYFLMTGYKLVISSRHNIVVEPSIIFNTDDSLSMSIKDLVKPMLKIYFERICIGTYFNNYEDFSFFFQYNYPGIYLGAFFEYPRSAPYYKRELFAEVAIGINITGKKLRNRGDLHW